MSGISWSTSATSGRSRRIASSAARPSSASPTTSTRPLIVSPRITPSRKKGWSSATTTRTRASGDPTAPSLGTARRGGGATIARRPTVIPGRSRARTARRRRPLGPDVTAVLVEHARRGVRLQIARARGAGRLRRRDRAGRPARARRRATCAAVAVGYAVAALGYRGVDARGRCGDRAVGVDGAVPRSRRPRLAHPADRRRDPQSWTSDVLTTGFLLVPVLAAAQLRPRICASVVVPAVARLPRRRDRDTERPTRNRGPRCCCARWSWPPSGPRAWRCRGSSARGCGRSVGWSTARTDLLAELDRAGAAGAAGPVRAAARRRAAVRARRPPGPRRGPRHRRPGGVRPARTGARWSRRACSGPTVAELHPAVLERAGLPAALRDLARNDGGARGSDRRRSTSTAGPSTGAPRSTGCSTGPRASCSATSRSTRTPGT